MKSIFAILAALAILSFTTTDIYVINKGASLHWLGKKTTGQHEGDVTLKSGTLNFDGSIPVKGEFVMDMTSMTSTDIKDAGDNKNLMDHLKGEEFFDVAHFPTATLTIKKFENLSDTNLDANYTVTADLTIKGVKNEIQFPAKISFKAGDVKAEAKITIDRTKWKIVYKSKTIFPTLGDKFIYDDMTFNVSLALHK